MSSNDNTDLLKRSWLPYQKNLIYLVKKHPITYLPFPSKRPTTKLIKAQWTTAWTEIGTQLSQTSETCRKVWSQIKYNYAKIINLINIGKIAKEAALSHPETGKYFDGLLSFMDPYVCKITDENIPVRVHKSINDLFCLETKQTQYVPPTERYADCFTHAQVKALLRERQSKEEFGSDKMDSQYLQLVVDTAVKRKLEELLLKKNDMLNPSGDPINTIKVPKTSRKILRNVRKMKPSFTLIPSKNISNNDEEHTSKTVNLGLETELIIEDDIKRESEDDNIRMGDDDDIKEKNLTLDKNINNTTEENKDLEYILPGTQTTTPAVHNTMKNTISSLNNEEIANVHKTDNIANMDNIEPTVTDDYIRNFFNELGIVMSLELSVSKQKTLKSRINELLKEILLKEARSGS